MSSIPALKTFQKDAVAEVVSDVKKILADTSLSRSRKVVLDSPTGSGKTRMLAEIIRLSLSHSLTIVLSPGAGNLGQQTHNALSAYLKDDAEVNVKELNIPLFQNPAAPGTVVVKNWEALTTRDKKTGAYSVYLTRDGDQKNLFDWLSVTAISGVPIAIIIDEAHYGNTNDAKAIQSFLNDINSAVKAGGAAAPVVIEASATPIDNPESPARTTYKVDREDVIKEGLMRKNGLLNAGVEDILKNMENSLSISAETVLLDGAIAKSDELDREYRVVGSKQHSLIAIQIPNSTPGKEAQERCLEYLANLSNPLTVENGTVAIFTSQTKTGSIDNISNADSPIRVLIYKQGIATGWDCPRAQVLVGFRHINSLIFSTQNLGRFSRTTEGRHYTLNESISAEKLNDFYVYSNINEVIPGFHPKSIKDGTALPFADMIAADEKKLQQIDRFNSYHAPSSVMMRTNQSGMDESKVGALIMKALLKQNHVLEQVQIAGIYLSVGSISALNLLDGNAENNNVFHSMENPVGNAAYEITARWVELLLSTIMEYGDIARKGKMVDLLSRRISAYYRNRLRKAGVDKTQLDSIVLMARMSSSKNYGPIECAIISVLKDKSLEVLTESYNKDEEGSFSIDNREFKFGGSFHISPRIKLVKDSAKLVTNGLSKYFLYSERDAQGVVAYRQEKLSGPEICFENYLKSHLTSSFPGWQLAGMHKNAPHSNGDNFSLALTILDKDENNKTIATNFFPDYLIFLKKGDLIIPLIIEIKANNPEGMDKNVAAKARAAKTYSEKTGIPFLVLTQEGPDSENFFVYGENNLSFGRYLENLNNVSIKTFSEYTAGSALPEELNWMRTLGQ